ncbi:HIT domain protein [uncultured archaeon]|nr:HIT domain protein [uncultured archaeon]
MLSEQETEEIKQKLISHIESTFPAEQIASARQQIESMNPSELETFLEKNNISKDEDSNSGCVFCSIASGKIKSVKLDENEKAVAVLEINPISKGHALIIPKNHDEEAGKEVLALAEKVSQQIKKKLKPKEVKISNSKLFGHNLVNVLPVYSNETFDSERERVNIEDLERVKEEIEKQPPKKEKKPKIEKIKEFLWLPKRIP